MSDTNIKDFDKVTEGYFNVPIEGNDEANEVWNILFTRNVSDLKNTAHSLFLKGLEELSMNEDRVPKVSELHSLVNAKTGWNLSPTDIEYTSALDWFRHLEDKNFVITKVIRSKKNLEYTPFPEAFHDIFGHLPFMCFPRYANMVHQFACKYNALTDENDKKEFANFWWYVVEFGLMREDGVVKAFGAGLMSSSGERAHAFSHNVILRPFDVEEMKITPISDHAFHSKLFVIESLEQIEQAIANWN